MGHHLNPDGRFQSDRHPGLMPDEIILSFDDDDPKAALGYLARPELARLAGNAALALGEASSKILLDFHDGACTWVLTRFALVTKDRELGEDIRDRLARIVAERVN